MPEKKEDGYWFSTENGTHIHAEKGETPKEATEKRFKNFKKGNKESAGKKADKIRDNKNALQDKKSELEKQLDKIPYENKEEREKIKSQIDELRNQIEKGGEPADAFDEINAKRMGNQSKVKYSKLEMGKGNKITDRKEWEKMLDETGAKVTIKGSYSFAEKDGEIIGIWHNEKNIGELGNIANKEYSESTKQNGNSWLVKYDNIDELKENFKKQADRYGIWEKEETQDVYNYISENADKVSNEEWKKEQNNLMQKSQDQQKLKDTISSKAKKIGVKLNEDQQNKLFEIAGKMTDEEIKYDLHNFLIENKQKGQEELDKAINQFGAKYDNSFEEINKKRMGK